MPSNWVTCPKCGEKHNASGDYTSPANRDKDRRRWVEDHESGKCVTGAASSTQYAPGELRIVRDVHVQISNNTAYHVEEAAAGHRRLTDEPVTEKDALQLMRDLGSPYPGQRYDDAPFARKPLIDNSITPPTNEQRFNVIKDQLIAATGSPGLTSFHHGKVHMTLGEWERLVSSITAAQEAAAAQTKEMHSRELHHFEEEQISAKALAVISQVRRLCDGVEYKVPGKHDTWDTYHEGKSALADKIQQVLDLTDPPRTATHERINTALNRAADEVLAIARDDGDELLRDAVNLVVNAGIHFLEHPDASLDDAVRENYDNDFADELLDSLR